MDKFQVAHDWAMSVINADVRAAIKGDLCELAWKYADEMQAEADKRKEKGVPDALLAKDENGNYPHFHTTLDIGECFDCGEVLKVSNSTPLDWQPDWGQAPDQAYYYAQDALCATWFIDKPTFVQGLWSGKSLGQAPSFDYQGNWHNSLRKRPQ